MDPIIRQPSRTKSIHLNDSENHFPKLLAISASSLSQYISQFLGTSNGRDKFMAMLQYAFDFYYDCAKHSNIDYVRVGFAQNDYKSVLVADSFNRSISQARKIYRLLKFLDEIKGIIRLPKTHKPLFFKMLSLAAHLASFMYYVSDNTLWGVGLMVRNGVLLTSTEHLWKNRKNKFSQINVLVSMIRLFVLLVLRQNKERRILSELTQNPGQFKEAQLVKKYLSLLKLRRKRRFEVLDFIGTLLRFFMLTKSLKMIGFKYLDPIFVATCGIVQAFISIFKSVYDKQIFIQLDKAKLTEKVEITSTKVMGQKLKFGSVSHFQE